MSGWTRVPGGWVGQPIDMKNIQFPHKPGWRERLTEYHAEGGRVYGPEGRIVHDFGPEREWGYGLMLWSLKDAHERAERMALELNAGGLRREKALREAGQ